MVNWSKNDIQAAFIHIFNLIFYQRRMCLHCPDQKETRKKATLILEDGTKFEGFSFGADKSVGGEIGMKIT